ncbi:cyclase family protein [Rhodococcus gannanensis]|uniref:Cyclase family protein n=1 Tax=Rhodococcus gannanensis TaxID=1960308 RepID=A0ABW4P921_9NOCA
MCSPDVMAQVQATIERDSRRSGIRRRDLFGAAGLAALGALAAPRVAAAAPVSISGTVVDLTHTLTPDFPVWPGNPQFAMRPVARIGGIGSVDAGSVGSGSVDTGSLGSADPASGFAVNELTYWEHTGTHLDAPAHKIVGGATAEVLPVADFVAPVVVVDIAAKAGADADAVLTVADLQDWESAHGRIPARALVAMYSGWEARLAVPGAFANLDALGVPHAPGFDPDAVDFLVAERDIVGIGVDTLSLDHASSRDHGAHVACLGAGRYGIEALANLDTIPPVGATVVVGAPKHVAATGGPCRVLALL